MPERPEIVAAYELLVASQQKEIAFLRCELERRTDAIRGLDALVREVLRRLPQSPPNARTSSPDSSRPSFAPSPGMVDSRCSRGDSDAMEIGPPPWRRPPPATPSEETWWQRWWSRLIGGK
jgi:hypothetical protein